MSKNIMAWVITLMNFVPVLPLRYFGLMNFH